MYKGIQPYLQVQATCRYGCIPLYIYTITNIFFLAMIRFSHNERVLSTCFILKGVKVLKVNKYVASLQFGLVFNRYEKEFRNIIKSCPI